MTKKPTKLSRRKDKVSPNKKVTAKQVANKKGISGSSPMHGKITEPLTSRRSNQKATSGTLLSKLKFWKRTEDGSDAYRSVKLRNKPVFARASVGASTRGSVENDINRFRLVWGIALAFLVVLIGRAFVLQVANAQFYIDKGDTLITSQRTQHSYRGMITDRNNLPLAVSAPLSSVSFSPYDYALAYYELKKEIEQSADKPKRQEKLRTRLEAMDLARLAAASGISLDRLQKSVAINNDIDVTDEEAVKAALPTGSGSHYLPLLNKVTPEIADAVTDLDFVAVHEKQEFRRYYPQPQPNAQLLGFMGYNSEDPESGYQGRAGIERQYESKLAGEDGKVLVLKDARQNSLKELKQVKPEIPGENVTLSIDSRLQYLLYKELEKVGRLQQARWSTGMVVDVHTGEVLALSTWPSFNNNNLNEMTGNNQRNRAVLDAFEPGSVMKPFTVAAALDSGKYTERSLINTSPGYIRVKGYTIRDHGNLGSINMAKLLQKSSNVASTKIALSLPPDGISSIQKRFGFGNKTALQFPGEQSGIVPTPKEKETARRATISYGYGLQVTLAQIAQAYAILGSGGVKHPLSLIRRDEKVPGERVIDADNAMAVVKMMETVTEPGGTGTQGAIDGYRIAAKTGTSRRVNPDGGYYTDQYRTVFAGIAPASNPRLVTVILVEDPRKDHYAGLVAAPVFKNVMQEALRLYNVPLDKPLKAQ